MPAERRRQLQEKEEAERRVREERQAAGVPALWSGCPRMNRVRVRTSP